MSELDKKKIVAAALGGILVGWAVLLCLLRAMGPEDGGTVAAVIAVTTGMVTGMCVLSGGPAEGRAVLYALAGFLALSHPATLIEKVLAPSGAETDAWSPELTGWVSLAGMGLGALWGGRPQPKALSSAERWVPSIFGAAGVVLVGLLIHFVADISYAAGREAPVAGAGEGLRYADAPFAQHLLALRAKAAGQPLPAGVDLPNVERISFMTLRPGAVREWRLAFPVTQLGATDFNVVHVARSESAADGNPGALRIAGVAPGAAEIILVVPGVDRWCSIGVRVISGAAAAAPAGTEEERRAAAEKLKAEADKLFAEAKGDAAVLAKALWRYRRLERMGQAADAHAPEIVRAVAKAEEALLKQYRSVQEKGDSAKSLQLVRQLLELYPVEDAQGSEELFFYHDDWVKRNRYQGEELRLESAAARNRGGAKK